jgi:hypothetical protein
MRQPLRAAAAKRKADFSVPENFQGIKHILLLRCTVFLHQLRTKVK